jgi:hypothetical protein
MGRGFEFHPGTRIVLDEDELPRWRRSRLSGGVIAYYDWDLPNAEKEVREAIALNLK